MQRAVLRRLAERPAGLSGLLGRPLACSLAASPRLSLSFSSSSSSSSAPLPPVYKTKKVWPPDFTLLTHQEQLRFEKRYKRRLALRAERPRWIKFVKLAQLFTITFVVVYCVLFMEWHRGPTPFDGFRAWLWDVLGTKQNSALQRQGPLSSTAVPPAAPPAAK